MQTKGGNQIVDSVGLLSVWNQFENNYPSLSSVTCLDLDIAEKQLQLLQWRRAMEMQKPAVNSSTFCIKDDWELWSALIF